MDRSPNLSLPYLAAAQAQKHVTHNEALRVLDAVVQVGALSRVLTAPPVSPDDGDCYLIAADPTGVWAGHADELAAFQDGVWAIYEPKLGWLAWIANEEALVAWDGSAWVVAGGGSVNPASHVGVNATADDTNRLNVKSDAALFSHDDVTPGSGDHRIIVNKSAAAKTASVVFQNGYSGRAEFGLAGDDDWHVKVSPDGSNWHEVLVAERTTGRVSFPNTLFREVLTGNRTYYVNGSTGSNSNDGLGSGTAFATLQYALNVVIGTLDFYGYTVTIQVADVTLTAGCSIAAGWTGGGLLLIQGNTSAPEDCFIDLASGSPFSITATLPGTLTIRGFRLRTAGNASLVQHVGRGTVQVANLELAGNGGGFAGLLSNNEQGARMIVAGGISVTGGGSCWLACQYGVIQFYGQTITFTGTLNFSWNTVYCGEAGQIAIASGGVTLDVSAATVTGKRYTVQLNSILNTNGGGPSYIPGSVAGTTATQGQAV